MKINKYDKIIDSNGNLIINNGGNSNSSSSTNSAPASRSGVEIDRNIWGKEDTGDDIDGHMTVNGDVHINSIKDKVIDPDDIDEDDDWDDDGDDIEEDKGGGNLFVEGDTTTKTLNTDTVMFNYPTVNDSRKNLLDILKQFDTRISDNSSEITKLWNALPTKVSQLENDSKYITESILNQTANEIRNSIPTKVSQLINDGVYITKSDLDSIDMSSKFEVDKEAPVVLFSGRLYSSNNNGTVTWGTWNISDRHCKHTGVSTVSVDYTNKSSSIPSLRIKLTAKEGYTVKPCSVTSMVMKATDYNPTSSKDENHRSKGYWMTGGVDASTDNIYLNAWRTRDTNNDSTNCNCLVDKVNDITVTIYGQCYKTETTPVIPDPDPDPIQKNYITVDVTNNTSWDYSNMNCYIFDSNVSPYTLNNSANMYMPMSCDTHNQFKSLVPHTSTEVYLNVNLADGGTKKIYEGENFAIYIFYDNTFHKVGEATLSMSQGYYFQYTI